MKSRSLQLGIAVAAAGLCLQPLAANAAKGDWLLRAGVGIVDPKSDNLELDLPAGLTGLPSDTTGTLQVDSGTSATIEATYFFADHWGIELLAAYPFSHDVDLDVAGVDGAEGFSGFSAAAAEVKHLPPTLSLQYHFNPEGTFRPYIGAGLNYTTFMSEKTTGILRNLPSNIDIPDVELEDSWGLAGQVGMDIGINENWFVNLGVRYIDIDSDTTLKVSDGIGGTNDADIGTTEIDPFVYQAQLGYRFGRAAPVVAAAVAAPVVAAVAAPPPPPPPPADTDGDGVIDPSDQCPDTPKGDRVGTQGCSCDVTRQVQFKLNSAELTDEDKVLLDEMAVNLTQLKFISGTVVGHTDSSGSEAYNQKLSERRAETVSAYLQGKGIAVGRLSASGAGESQPIADNTTAEGRATNRRVVLKRTDCDAPQ